MARSDSAALISDARGWGTGVSKALTLGLSHSVYNQTQREAPHSVRTERGAVWRGTDSHTAQAPTSALSWVPRRAEEADSVGAQAEVLSNVTERGMRRC